MVRAMASYELNPAAVKRARELIEARQYVLRSDWGDVQPKADAENAYLENHGWEDYGRWFLGLTEGASDETKARRRLRLRRLPSHPPQRVDRLRVPRRRMAPQGDRAGGTRPPPAAGPRQRLTRRGRAARGAPGGKPPADRGGDPPDRPGRGMAAGRRA